MMGIEEPPIFEKMKNDAELAISVTKHLEYSLRRHFLNRKLEDDASLGTLLKASTLNQSVKHMILKRIVEVRDGLVHDTKKTSFTEEERLLFVVCSKAVFSYLSERLKVNERMKHLTMKKNVLVYWNDSSEFRWIAQLSS